MDKNWETIDGNLRTKKFQKEAMNKKHTHFL